MKVDFGSGREQARLSGRRFVHLLASVLFFASSAPAAAQAAPPPPPPTPPVLPPTREEVTRPVTPTATPPGARLEVEGGIERAPCALDGPEFASIHFVMRGAEFEGLQGLVPWRSADAADALANTLGAAAGAALAATRARDWLLALEARLG